MITQTVSDVPPPNAGGAGAERLDLNFVFLTLVQIVVASLTRETMNPDAFPAARPKQAVSVALMRIRRR